MPQYPSVFPIQEPVATPQPPQSPRTLPGLPQTQYAFPIASLTGPPSPFKDSQSPAGAPLHPRILPDPIQQHGAGTGGAAAGGECSAGKGVGHRCGVGGPGACREWFGVRMGDVGQCWSACIEFFLRGNWGSLWPKGGALIYHHT